MRQRKLRAGLAVVATAALASLLPVTAAHAASATNLTPDPYFLTPTEPAGAFATYCGTGDGSANCMGSQFGATTVNTGSVDLYAPGFLTARGVANVTAVPGAPATAQSVDLDGNVPGSISQQVHLTANTYYVASVYVATNIGSPPPRSFSISLAGAPAQVFTLNTATTTGYQYTATNPILAPGTGTYPVTVSSLDANDQYGDLGAVITDLEVNPAPPGSTPMASAEIAGPAAGLLLLGLAGWYVSRRRRRSASTPPLA